MKKNIYCLPLLLVSSICYAEPNVKCHNTCSVVTKDFIIPAHGFANTSRPADSLSFESFIWGSSQAEAIVCGSNEANYDLGRILYVPNLSFIRTVKPLGFAPRNLFQSNHDAYHMSYTYISNNLFNTDLMNSHYMQVTTIGERSGEVFSGRLVNAQRTSTQNTKIAHFQALYKGAGREATGQFSFHALNGNPIITYQCYDTNGTLKEITRIHAESIPSTIEVRTCEVNRNSATATLPPVSLDALKKVSVGEVVSGAATTLQFSLSCDKNINVFASLVDLNDVSNRSYVAKLSPASTATGVGLTVYNKGKPYKFGMDNSSAYQDGNNNSDVDRFYVGTSENVNNFILTHDLQFFYAKTSETPTSGTVQGIIGITYSYQ